MIASPQIHDQQRSATFNKNPIANNNEQNNDQQ